MTWQTDNRVSCDRAQAVLALIPVIGLCLILAGCALTANRAMIQHKERVRALMERHMKPPLQESAAAIWWGENWQLALAAAAGGLMSVYKNVRGGREAP
jgi:hypothetical protein